MGQDISRCRSLCGYNDNFDDIEKKNIEHMKQRYKEITDGQGKALD